MARGLSKDFIGDLQNGMLQSLVERVKNDWTLDLEIRKNKINVYYRGVNILDLTENSAHKYSAVFDVKYTTHGIPAPTLPSLPRTIDSNIHIITWIDSFPLLKLHMDLYFANKKAQEEREFQQLTVRENNWSGTSNYTDFYICDMEYSSSGNQDFGRFDMVGVHWPRKKHKQKDAHGLAVFEIKYGDSSMRNNLGSGLLDHFQKTVLSVAVPQKVFDFKTEMAKIFTQKASLGLIANRPRLESFGDQTILYVIVAINHNPDSTVFGEELKKIREKQCGSQKDPTASLLDVRVILASAMGLGLYDKYLLTIDEALKHLSGSK